MHQCSQYSSGLLLREPCSDQRHRRSGRTQNGFCQTVSQEVLDLDSVRCKECSCEINFAPCANFVVLCPGCLKYSYIECEYGYGPVVPCSIFLGEKEIGTVTQRGYKYILQTQYSDEITVLENQYLEALEEAAEIVKSKIEK